MFFKYIMLPIILILNIINHHLYLLVLNNIKVKAHVIWL